MNVNLLIDGSTYGSSLLEHSWDVQLNLGSALDQMVFALDDPANAISLDSGKEVLFGSADDTAVYYFGGVLMEVATQTAALGRRHMCKALDWTFVLSRAVVSEVYRGRSDASIINSTSASPKGIFHTGHTDLSDFNSTSFVTQGIPDTKFLRFQSEPIANALDALAELAGFVWWVDPDRRLHYGEFDASASTFSLSDAPDDLTSFPFFGARRVQNFAQNSNEVELIGGKERTELADIPLAVGERIFASDGVTNPTNAEYDWVASSTQEVVAIYRNIGDDVTPNWEAATVGLFGRDSSDDFQVLWYPPLHTITWSTAAPPNLTNSFRVDGDRLTRVHFRMQDENAVAAAGGRVYTHVIKDASVVSQDQAENRVVAELQKRAGFLEKVTLRCNHDGMALALGQKIPVTSSVLGVSGTSYIAEKIVMRPLGVTLIEYDVALFPEANQEHVSTA